MKKSIRFWIAKLIKIKFLDSVEMLGPIVDIVFFIKSLVECKRRLFFEDFEFLKFWLILDRLAVKNFLNDLLVG